MTQHHAELLMYTAPEPIRVANERWLARILEHLGHTRLNAEGLSLRELWLSPNLLLTQTCGYPLMTALKGQIRVIGRPRYELPDASAGNHCSLILSRADDPRKTLPAFRDSRGVINSEDSNSGMNLLRQRLAPLHRDGQFFSTVGNRGGHREVRGLRVVGRSAFGPTLPFITSASATDEQIERLRQVMNQSLHELPDVVQTLGLPEVLAAGEGDYQVVLDYLREAHELGYGRLR